jgi:hypothetical protein
LGCVLLARTHTIGKLEGPFVSARC